jgi:hypothetical protein
MLVTLPAGADATVNCAPLSAVVVAGVVLGESRRQWPNLLPLVS